MERGLNRTLLLFLTRAVIENYQCASFRNKLLLNAGYILVYILESQLIMLHNSIYE